MKKLLLKLMPLAILMTAALAACTEESSQNENPVFPEPVILQVEPAGEVAVNFSANLDWKLSIPAGTDAFRLIDGSQEVFSVRGRKGDVTVNVRCIAQDMDFEDHSTDLTLEMGGQKKVIASVVLSSDSRKMNVVPADVSDGAFVPSSDDRFDWSYTGSPLQPGANIEMIWDLKTMAYKAYVRVESNYTWKFGKTPEGIDVSGGKVSGLFKEYTFSLSVPSLESAKTIPFSIVASDDNSVETAFNLVVPKHTPVFSVRKVLVKNGFFELSTETEGWKSYDYEKTPMSDNDTIELIWPEDRVGFSYYLYIDANFDYQVKTPEWLSAKKTASEGAGSELELSALSVSTDIQSGDLVFSLKGTDFSKVYSVSIPSCATIVKDDVPAEVEFNEEGKMKDMNGEFSIVSKEYNVTSSGKLQYFKFVKDGDWYKSEALSQMQGGQGCTWLKIEDNWSDNSPVLQNYIFRITAETNDGGERSALVVGVPSSVKVDDPDGQILNSEGTDVADEFAGYLVIKAMQHANIAASGEPISAVDPEYWPQSLSSFKTLDQESGWEYSEVADYFQADHYYKLTYGADVSSYPTVGEYSFLKFHRKYTDYKVYSSSDKVNPVADKDNFWITVNPSKYAEDEVSIQMTPDKCKDDFKEAFIVFSDGNGDFAAIYCAYDPDYNFSAGGSTIAPAFQYPEYAMDIDGSKLVELKEGDPLFGEWNPGDGTPLWHLTFTSENPTMSMLTGLPQGMSYPNSEWISVEPMGEITTIYMDKTLVPQEAWVDGKVTSSVVFYGADWSPAMTLVCTLDLSRASAR